MKTFEIGFGNSYPHYYTLNGIDNAGDSNSNVLTGVSHVTGSYLEKQPVNIGDELKIKGDTHTITEMVEVRPAKGVHVMPATFFHAKCTYVRNKPTV